MVLSTCGVSGRSVVFIEENILIYTWNFPCSNLRCCLSLCYCAPLRRIWLYLVYTLLLGSCRSSLCLSSLKAGQTQFSSVGHAPQSPLCLNGPPLDSLKYVNVIFIVESQKQDTVLQVWSSKCQTEKNNQFCRPAVHTPANTAQYVAGHLHCKGMLVNHVQLFVHQNLQAIFSKAAFSPSGSNPYRCRSYDVADAGLCIIVCIIN